MAGVPDTTIGGLPESGALLETSWLPVVVPLPRRYTSPPAFDLYLRYSETVIFRAMVKK